MNTWIACAWALPAWTALGLAMDRHYPQLFNGSANSQTRWMWRTLGVVGLLLSLCVCWQRWAPSVAIAAWLGVLSLTGLAAALFWTYAPQWLRYAAPISAMLGLIGLFL